MVVQHYLTFWNGADVLDKRLIPYAGKIKKNRFIFNWAAMTNLSFRHSFLLLKELLISLSEIAAAKKTHLILKNIFQLQITHEPQ